MQNLPVQLVLHPDINREKWDLCIAGAINSRPYSYSWYLDAVAPGWNALVGGDYQAVMPLPQTKKAGISLLLQPPFTQQLGVFSRFPLQEQDTLQFFKAIPSSYLLWDIHIHHACPLPDMYQKHTSKRANYLLDLQFNQDYLYRQYASNTRRNIKKASGYNLKVEQQPEIEPFVHFMQKHLMGIKTKHYSTLNKLLLHAKANNHLSLFKITAPDNTWLAAAAFISGNDRYIMISNASSKTGKQKRAMFLLLHSLISKWSGKNVLLDFEGSQLPGVARFFKGFGAKAETYQKLQYAPWPLIQNLYRFWKKDG